LHVTASTVHEGGKAPVVHSAGLDFPEAAGYFVR
jgi:hypothetical protein